MAAPIAAIVHADRREADRLVGEFATALLRAGRDVHGLVQWRPPAGKPGTALIDLHSGEHHRLFQKLGAGSASCSLDTHSLATASMALRRALDARADLVIANRFGPLEASGGGLAAEMLALMAEHIPFLTIVADEYLSAWRTFTGSAGVELPARRDALDAWFTSLTKESS
jgi:hypothetical protein